MMSAGTSKRFVASFFLRFQNPSSPTRYCSAPRADNCGGELVTQAEFS
jgi:hypothetical protein